jgi:hypothetical protein
MRSFKFLFSIAVLIALGSSAWAQDPIRDDPGLSTAQKKSLTQFKRDLENRPVNPNAADQYLSKVQGSLKQLFAANNTPSADCTNNLATTLYNGLNSGQISVETSVLLSKEISKVLGAKQLTYQEVNQFTRNIDPLVQQTTLGPTERLKLYRDALIILKTVPNYVPESR